MSHRDLQVRLQRADPSGFEALSAFVREYYEFDSIPFGPNVEAGIQALLADPRLGFAWFIEADGIVAGYAVLTLGFDHEYGGTTSILTDFYLKPEFRGQGIGPQVLSQIETEARQNKINTIELCVIEGNDRARRTYEKAGFKAQDRTPMIKRLVP